MMVIKREVGGWNVKGAARIAMFSCFVLVVIALGILFFSLPGVSSISKDILEKSSFTLGQSVRINLQSYDSYQIKLQTPRTTFLKEGSHDILLYTPSEEGNYRLMISSHGKNLRLSFNVKKEGVLSADVPQEQLVVEPKTSDGDSLQSSSAFDDSFEQERAVLGKPVQWKKKVYASVRTNLSFNIPREAKEISFVKYSENDEGSPRVFQPVSSSKVRLRNISLSQELVISVQSAESVEVQYSTPAPQAVEQPTVSGKIIKVSGSDEVHYKDVTLYTSLEKSLKIRDPSSIHIYWKENEQYLPPQEVRDSDSDGFYDYVSWVAPHLSNQTFEIIVITKAERLDSSGKFISDIYPEVRALDGIWSEAIRDGEYVRVTFEKNLTKENDITIYPRVVSGTPSINVYEKEGTKVIASFDSLKSNNYNKVLLSSLEGSQDTFDLQIVGGSVEIDHIIDPQAEPGGATRLQVQYCRLENNSANPTNFSFGCAGSYPGACGANDRESCNDNNYESVNTVRNLYGGIRVNVSNSTINPTTGCNYIKQVFVCYSWNMTSNTANSRARIAVSNSTSQNFVNATTTAPTNANRALTCVNMTSNVSWGCSDFFGAGPGALILAETYRTGAGAGTIQIDSLFYNVSYSTDFIYPKFYNYSDSNGTLIGSGTAWFNASINNTNATVFLQINGANYTASNATGIWNVSVALTTGVYGYQWITWSNSTDRNLSAYPHRE